MKKLAILTWYNKGMNCGQSLQAYALQRAFAKLHVDAVTITYEPKAIEYRKGLGYRRYLYKTAGFRKSVRQYRFNQFVRKNMKVSKPCFTRSDVANEIKNGGYTHLVCGSDQVWNPAAFDLVFFLFFGKGINLPKISYAPSIIEKWQMVFYKNQIKNMQGLITDFDYVSVREESGAEIVKELTGIDAPVVLDPTLLLTEDEWRIVVGKKKRKGNYLLCYFLGNLHHRQELIEKIARKHNVDSIIAIESLLENKVRKGWINEKHIGPAEFVSLIKDAHIICTDSFHAVAFSIIFSKSFFAFNRIELNNPGSKAPKRNPYANNTRISNFLAMMGINDRIITNKWDIYKTKEINYAIVQKLLQAEREKSIRFIKRSIGFEVGK